MFKFIIISIVCLVAGLLLLQAVDPNISTPQNVTVYNSDDDDRIAVTIEGEIVVPGIYTVDVTDTFSTLVLAAGGLLETADKDAINMSAIIGDHDYFYVPSISSYSNQCEITTEVEKININTATASQLATLTYISTALANKIVEYRDENGPFETLEDIMNVSGIGRATYEKIRDYIKLK